MFENKEKIEKLLVDIESRLNNSTKLTVSNRKEELEEIGKLIKTADNELSQFQMFGFAKFSAEIDRFETQLDTMKTMHQKMTAVETPSNQNPDHLSLNESKNFQNDDVVHQKIAQTSQKLIEGKQRARSIFKIANNMKDELNLLDDEVELQKEKLLAINDQLKNTQDIMTQAKLSVISMGKAINQDGFMKRLIVIITAILLLVIFMSFRVKAKKMKIEEALSQKVSESKKKANYDDIDEKYFYLLKAKFEGDFEIEKNIKPNDGFLKNTKAQEKKKESTHNLNVQTNIINQNLNENTNQISLANEKAGDHSEVKNENNIGIITEPKKSAPLNDKPSDSKLLSSNIISLQKIVQNASDKKIINDSNRKEAKKIDEKGNYEITPARKLFMVNQNIHETVFV